MRILSTDSRTWMLACAAVLALALTGCASTETSKPAEPAKSAKSTQPEKPAPPAAAPAAAAPDAGIATPTGDFANVVFFRESKFVGSMVSFKVREGEQELGSCPAALTSSRKCPSERTHTPCIRKRRTC